MLEFAIALTVGFICAIFRLAFICMLAVGYVFLLKGCVKLFGPVMGFICFVFLAHGIGIAIIFMLL